jgi:two-component system, chemotaxis family, CheB/CheR fusion protein
MPTKKTSSKDKPGSAPPKRAVIAGIGASAGGVQALQALFSALPGNTGVSFVVIVHLDPNIQSELARILMTRTNMPVLQVESKTLIEPDHVYIIPPNRQLLIDDGHVSAEAFSEPRGQRAPIDSFFKSLAEQQGDGFAVILSGAGSDGASGVKAVKESGGIILVQDPTEAEYPSMPRSAISTGVADFVLPVTGIASRLAELARTKRAAALGNLDSNEELMRRVLAHVRVRTGHDFAKYKNSTVSRRIARRMQVTRREDLASYYMYLRESAEEVSALFNDLLISVTHFFRDAEVFEKLGQQIVPQLFKGDEDPIRVWVPGCATGEEAYSVGILLLEEAARQDIRPEIQIFASDLDTSALTIAREGRYPSGIESDVSEERLRRYFSREGDHYRVKRELRDIILFANHNLLRDPPFSHLDLITCRNLLIYLDRELQTQACSTFHYALRNSGYLLLGTSESADNTPTLFRVIDREARIYQSSAQASDKFPIPPRLLSAPRFTEQLQGGFARPRSSLTGAGETAAHRQALERQAPPSALVDVDHLVIHLSDNAGRFLQPSAGPLNTDITELVRPELRFHLRAALNRAFERKESTLTVAILVRFNGAAHRVYLQVRPVAAESDGSTPTALIFFIEGEAVEVSADGSEVLPEDHRAADETIRQLREELQLTQHRLRATREDSEAANEELRAANEELQSINEEYRSTSEELETSKEELQSINEELQTVNNELKFKLEGVSRAHSDLQNLMAATDFGILFLDPALRIKRFTPRVTDLFNIKASDEDRPITDFTHQLEYDGFNKDAQAVLLHLAPIEREIHTRNGRWYQMRLRPYRTVDDKIDGVVVSFVDISDRHRVEEALRQTEQNLRQENRLVDLSRAPLFVWDFDGGILRWNRGCEELYGYTADEALGKNKEKLLNTAVPGSTFVAVRQQLVDEGSWRGKLRQKTKDGREVIVESQLELTRVDGRRIVLEGVRDIADETS